MDTDKYATVSKIPDDSGQNVVCLHSKKSGKVFNVEVPDLFYPAYPESILPALGIVEDTINGQLHIVAGMLNHSNEIPHRDILIDEWVKLRKTLYEFFELFRNPPKED